MDESLAGFAIADAASALSARTLRSALEAFVLLGHRLAAELVGPAGHGARAGADALRHLVLVHRMEGGPGEAFARRHHLDHLLRRQSAFGEEPRRRHEAVEH